MRRTITVIAIGLAIVILVSGGGIAYLLIFGAATPPKPLASVVQPFDSIDFAGLPKLEHYLARDGASLSYRTYAAGERLIVLLIHGSSGSSSSMHPLAKALQEAGITVYVPDLRGHGDNQPHGDVAYIGQLDHDVADFVNAMHPHHPNARWALVGFSSGGGFALRIAAGPLGQSFERYLLLAPFLRYDAPTERGDGPAGQAPEEKQVWAAPAVQRMIGLGLLNSAGIHAFDWLPVIYFAVPPDKAFVTSSYSWRMLLNFQPDEDYAADIRAVSKPMQILVGEKDEFFLPDKFASVFDADRKDLPVTILPGLSHVDLVTNPVAIHAVVTALNQ